MYKGDGTADATESKVRRLAVDVLGQKVLSARRRAPEIGPCASKPVPAPVLMCAPKKKISGKRVFGSTEKGLRVPSPIVYVRFLHEFFFVREWLCPSSSGEERALKDLIVRVLAWKECECLSVRVIGVL